MPRRAHADHLCRACTNFMFLLFCVLMEEQPCQVIKSVVLCRGLLKEFHRRDMITSSNTWAAWHYMAAWRGMVGGCAEAGQGEGWKRFRKADLSSRGLGRSCLIVAPGPDRPVLFGPRERSW